MLHFGASNFVNRTVIKSLVLVRPASLVITNGDNPTAEEGVSQGFA